MDIKKFIAREGFTLLGIIGVGALFSFGGTYITEHVDIARSTLPSGFVLDSDLEKIKTNAYKMDAIGVSANEIDKYLLSEGLTLEEANRLSLRPKRDYYKEEIQGKQPQVDLSSYSDKVTLKHEIGSTPAKEIDMCRQGWSESLDKLTEDLKRACAETGVC